MALIELRDVSKSYRRDALEIPVLNGVTITVPAGDFMGLMGPSGSGKSTLLNLLAGIDRPTRGSIRVADTEISSLSERALAGWRARHIGFIFQLYNLIPVLTAFENVELPLLLTTLSKSQRRDHVMTALNIVGLGDREKHYPRQLFFFSSRRRHTRCGRDWSSDVCSSDLGVAEGFRHRQERLHQRHGSLPLRHEEDRCFLRFTETTRNRTCRV